MMPNWTVVLPLLHAALLIGGIVAVRHVSMRGWPERRETLTVAAICGFAFVFTFAISEPFARFADLRRAYFPAGEAALHDPGALAALIDRGVHGFVNLPILAYVFAPLALMSWQLAAATFLGLGVILAVAAWHVLARLATLDRQGRWLLLFLFAASGPLIYSLREGNTSHMVLLGLGLGLLLLRRGDDLLAGLLLGLMAIVKLPLLLFGVYFVLRWNRDAVIGFSIACAGAAAGSLVLFDWSMHLLWFERCVLHFASHPLGAFNVQSLQALLMRILEGPDVLRSWDPREIPTAQRLAGSVLGLTLYVAAIAACVLRLPAKGALNRADTPDRMTIEFLIVICLAVLGSPLSWSHYYSWLLLPIAFLLVRPSPLAGGRASRWVGWAAIVMVSSVVRLPDLNGSAMVVYSTTVISLPLLGGLIIFALLLRARLALGSTAARPCRQLVENRAHDGIR